MEPVTYSISALAVLGIAFIVFRILVRRDYQRSGRLTLLSTLLEYLAIFAWVAHGWLNRPSDWPAIHVGPVLEVAGWTLFIGGFGLVLIGIAWLGIRRSHGLQVNSLKQTGLYAASRNPQVVVFVLGIIGYTILWPSWRNVGVVVLAALLSHMMVLSEEEHLSDVFGAEYDRYRATVPRYLGFKPQRDA
jgi:protein-S-isoprenylcysteine O-methyltransferase Ste14